MKDVLSFVTVLQGSLRSTWPKLVRSVFNQSDENWNWVIAVPSTIRSKDLTTLTRLSDSDVRVHLVSHDSVDNEVELFNLALEKIRSDFFVMLPADVLLDHTAVEVVHASLSQQADIDMFYTNEDRISWFGRHTDQSRKPIWSPEKLRSHLYFGALTGYRTENVRQAGGLDPHFGEAAHFDLALKVSERARTIFRIEQVLCHRFSFASIQAKNGQGPLDQRMLAVDEHLARVGIDAVAAASVNADYLRVVRNTSTVGAVSVVIPTMGSSGRVRGQKCVYVEALLESLVENSDGLQVEYVVVYDSHTPMDVLERLKQIAGIDLTLVEFSEEFSFSRKCNLGASTAKHENLVFLNDDMSCLSSNVLANLISPLQEPDVGVTGAKLFFEDGSIQHGGHIHDLGDNRINYHRASGRSEGVRGALLINREVSGVTGACMAVTKTVFWQVDGFSEVFPNSYNDVDFSNKVRAAGYRILWLADVKLAHYESKSRVPKVYQRDYENIQERWGASPEEFFA